MKYLKNFFFLTGLLVFTNNTFSQQYLTFEELENLSRGFTSTVELKNLQYILNPKGYFSTQKEGKIFSDNNSFVDNFNNELVFSHDDSKTVMLQNFFWYKLISPSKAVSDRYLTELKKSFQKFTLGTGSTNRYTREGKYIITFETKIEKGKSVLVFNVWNNLSKGWLVPAKIISKNKIEVNSFTQSTNIFLNANDTIYLKSSGIIKYGAMAGSGNPDGIEGFESYSVDASLKHGSLIGKMYGKWRLIGTYTAFVAKKSGPLSLEVNDADPSNNEGSYIVEYSINKELKPD